MSYDDARINQYYLLASSVAFYYDFISTLPQEYEHVWSKPKGSINALILLLRYTAVVSYAAVLAFAFSPGLVLNWFDPGNTRIDFTVFNLFMVIRVFAIYDKRYWILYIVVPMASVNLILSGVVMSVVAPLSFLENEYQTATGISFLTSSCFVSPEAAWPHTPLLFKLSYTSALTFDTLVCGLTVLKIGRIHRAKRWMRSNSSLSSILLRDGCILYLVLIVGTHIELLSVFLFVVDDLQPSVFPRKLDPTAILMTMLPFDVYVHPSFSYKPNEWLATSSQPTKASLVKKTIVTAAALGFVAAAGALVWMVDREVLMMRMRDVLGLAGVGVGI
ncbi:hypothetical protein SCHPADRAFT_941242 [Schizopora paradoxa]|uniref:DUF6533 domain-containing protein n=1 Tax=Schizopora paradoxa TaxID=27342 RepID=A0A0H2RKB9_9AGAM|nr:hypothetical protein SCHPADRAFT_941242 [Schizopora paradoxa]